MSELRRKASCSRQISPALAFTQPDGLFRGGAGTPPATLRVGSRLGDSGTDWARSSQVEPAAHALDLRLAVILRAHLAARPRGGGLLA